MLAAVLQYEILSKAVAKLGWNVPCTFSCLRRIHIRGFCNIENEKFINCSNFRTFHGKIQFTYLVYTFDAAKLQTNHDKRKVCTRIDNTTLTYTVPTKVIAMIFY